MKPIKYSLIAKNFYVNKEGKVHIYVKFNYLNESIIIPTNEFVDAPQFKEVFDENNKKKKVVIPNTNRWEKTNQFRNIGKKADEFHIAKNDSEYIQRENMDKKIEAIRKINDELLLQGKVITVEVIKERLEGKSAPDEMTLLKVYEEFKPTFFRTVSESTQAGYETTFDHIKTFLQTHKDFKRTDLPLRELTKSFLPKFYDYLMTKGFKYKTARSYCQKLSCVIDYAVTYDYLTSFPFTKLKVRKPKDEVDTPPTSLTVDELILFMNAKLTGREELYRDEFMVVALTGFAQCDFNKLTVEHIQKEFLSKRREKTGILATPVLNDFVFSLIKKYMKGDYFKKTGKLFPPIHRFTINTGLKRIAKKLEIKRTFIYMLVGILILVWLQQLIFTMQ